MLCLLGEIKNACDEVLSSLLKAGGIWTMGSPEVLPHFSIYVILYRINRDFLHCSQSLKRL